jgi:hypothetical protein
VLVMKKPTQNTSLADRAKYFRWRDDVLAEQIAAEKDGFCHSRLMQKRTSARRQLRELESIMRRDDTASVPAVGWELIVKRQITSGGKIYPVGCVIAPEVLGRNLQAFLSGHYVEWAPPGAAKPSARPRDLPPPAPEKPRPAVEIVSHADPVESWRLTKAAMAEKCSNDAARAEDILLRDRDGCALFLRATKVWCDGEAKRRGVVSVSPAGL